LVAWLQHTVIPYSFSDDAKIVWSVWNRTRSICGWWKHGSIASLHFTDCVIVRCAARNI